jgi:hypothetical protein
MNAAAVKKYFEFAGNNEFTRMDGPCHDMRAKRLNVIKLIQHACGRKAVNPLQPGPAC